MGKALDLRERVEDQLNNNKLMNALLHAPNGTRQLLVGKLTTKTGQQANKAILIIESGLIKLALANGHKIVNVKGTRLTAHRVSMRGNRKTMNWFDARELYFESKS